MRSITVEPTPDQSLKPVTVALMFGDNGCTQYGVKSSLKIRLVQFSDWSPGRVGEIMEAYWKILKIHLFSLTSLMK